MRVEAHGVAKRFGRVEALRGVSFALAAGRRAALVGPNGSGKSTLNRVLMGLLRHTGEVSYDGRSLRRERAALASRLAYVPQAPPHLSASVAEIVEAVARVRGLPGERLERVARGLELELSSVARSSFDALSGGTKQKLLLTLALASGASFLVLDEPSASLDARARERFFELFAGLPRETTLLLCSHRLDEIRPLVEHVLALEEGRVVYDGPVEGFLEARAVSVLEVSAVGEQAAAWLRARGFRAGAAGWWLRTVERGEKRRLVAELAEQLGESVRDLNVRELEELETAPGRSKPGNGGG